MSSPKKQGMPEDEESPVDYFSHLDDVCLAKIFMYLPIKQRLQVAMVCKRWRDAVLLAWVDVKILNFNDLIPWYEDPKHCISDRCIATILRYCGASLQGLAFGDHVNVDVLQVVMDHYCNLTKLELNVVHSNPSLLPALFRSLRLESIRIKSVYCLSVFKGLSSETLTGMHLVAGRRFPFKQPEIFQQFPKLTTVELENFTVDSHTLTAINQQNQLTQLSLPDSEVDMSSLIQFTNLETLNLCGAEGMTDDILIALSINCKKIRFLHLQKAFNISDLGVQALADLPELDDLDLSETQVTDQHLGALCHLKKLNVTDSAKVCDTGVIHLLRSAVNLQYLILAGTFVTENVLRAAADASSRRNASLKVIVKRPLKTFWRDYAALYPLLIIQD